MVKEVRHETDGKNQIHNMERYFMPYASKTEHYHPSTSYHQFRGLDQINGSTLNLQEQETCLKNMRRKFSGDSSFDGHVLNDDLVSEEERETDYSQRRKKHRKETLTKNNLAKSLDDSPYYEPISSDEFDSAEEHGTYYSQRRKEYRKVPDILTKNNWAKSLYDSSYYEPISCDEFDSAEEYESDSRRRQRKHSGDFQVTFWKDKQRKFSDDPYFHELPSNNEIDAYSDEKHETDCSQRQKKYKRTSYVFNGNNERNSNSESKVLHESKLTKNSSKMVNSDGVSIPNEFVYDPSIIDQQPKALPKEKFTVSSVKTSATETSNLKDGDIVYPIIQSMNTLHPSKTKKKSNYIPEDNRMGKSYDCSTLNSGCVTLLPLQKKRISRIPKVSTAVWNSSDGKGNTVRSSACKIEKFYKICHTQFPKSSGNDTINAVCKDKGTNEHTFREKSPNKLKKTKASTTATIGVGGKRAERLLKNLNKYDKQIINYNSKAMLHTEKRYKHLKRLSSPKCVKGIFPYHSVDKSIKKLDHPKLKKQGIKRKTIISSQYKLTEKKPSLSTKRKPNLRPNAVNLKVQQQKPNERLKDSTKQQQVSVFGLNNGLSGGIDKATQTVNPEELFSVPNVPQRLIFLPFTINKNSQNDRLAMI